MSATTTAHGLDLQLRSLSQVLTPDLAKALLAWKADAAAQARYDELADKNTEGQLTPEEARELESIVRFDSAVSLIKAHAHVYLSKAG